MKLVIDVDGRVHHLLTGSGEPIPVGFGHLDRWPQGHVDARMRRVKPAPEGAHVTCLACLYAWDRLEAFALRTGCLPPR